MELTSTPLQGCTLDIARATDREEAKGRQKCNCSYQVWIYEEAATSLENSSSNCLRSCFGT